ncbi:hypothetical protein MKI77_005419 [Escherichia coli]|nr:hypothetical protein [Escherichia coli]
MSINNIRDKNIIFVMKAVLEHLVELDEKYMDEGNGSLEFTTCVAMALIEPALNIIERQQEEIDRLRKAAKGMLEE